MKFLKSRLRKFAAENFSKEKGSSFSKGWSDKFMVRNKAKIDEWMAKKDGQSGMKAL